MLGLGPVAFMAPLALAALIALPVLWWLMRVTPPAPERIRFPAITILAPLRQTDAAPTATPLWLKILRLVMAALVILAVAHPVADPAAPLPGSGAIVIAIDDGWAAAGDWTARRGAVAALIDRAGREERAVALVPTAADPDADRLLPAFEAAGQARERLDRLQPRPWPVDRAAAAAALARLHGASGGGGAAWYVSDGIDAGADGDTLRLLEALGLFGPVTALTTAPERLPLLLRGLPDGSGSEARIERVATAADRTGQVLASADDGSTIASSAFHLAAEQATGAVSLAMPPELAQRLARLDIVGENGAGGVVLGDARWRRRPVGLITDASATDQPLLSGGYFVEKAFAGSSEFHSGPLDALLKRDLAVLVLADGTFPGPGTVEQVERWVAGGGVLLRFAGPELLAAPDRADGLLPAPLLPRQRMIGGSLSWEKPAAIAPFPETSPFFGLAVPADITIEGQALPRPGSTEDVLVWAALDDGTPLITARRIGQGWVVLVHTTANTVWSSLPLSGLFVDIGRRIVAMASGVFGQPDREPLSPIATLDAWGRSGPPPPAVRAIPAGGLRDLVIGPEHPPGIYGNGEARVAVNLGDHLPALKALPALPPGVATAALAVPTERDLRPWLLAAAMLLALADLAYTLFGHRLPGRRPRQRVAPLVGAVLVALVIHPAAVRAASIVADGTAEKTTLAVHLAYVRSGDAAVDRISLAALSGLTRQVNRRTSAVLAPPVAVDPAVDDLASLPLLYWPVVGGASPPGPETVARLTAFRQSGGTILFDVREPYGESAPDLRRLADGLGLPPLEPVAGDHVLGRAFYLLDSFPGRWQGGTVWVEKSDERINDGVASVIAGRNDWAGAWAIDESQRPMFAVGPGGERQRERAFRFGVNVVMYVLTGNYKGDQVHLPAILERLTQ